MQTLFATRKNWTFSNVVRRFNRMFIHSQLAGNISCANLTDVCTKTMYMRWKKKTTATRSKAMNFRWRMHEWNSKNYLFASIFDCFALNESIRIFTPATYTGFGSNRTVFPFERNESNVCACDIFSVQMFSELKIQPMIDLRVEFYAGLTFLTLAVASAIDVCVCVCFLHQIFVYGLVRKILNDFHSTIF